MEAQSGSHIIISGQSGPHFHIIPYKNFPFRLLLRSLQHIFCYASDILCIASMYVFLLHLISTHFKCTSKFICPATPQITNTDIVLLGIWQIFWYKFVQLSSYPILKSWSYTLWFSDPLTSRQSKKASVLCTPCHHWLNTF